MVLPDSRALRIAIAVRTQSLPGLPFNTCQKGRICLTAGCQGQRESQQKA